MIPNFLIPESEICDLCGVEVAKISIEFHKISCQKRQDLNEQPSRNLIQIPFIRSQICSTCSQPMTPDHKCDLQLCEFCQDILPSKLYAEHVIQCGSRTEQCEICNRYILLRDFSRHRLENSCRPLLPPGLLAFQPQIQDQNHHLIPINQGIPRNRLSLPDPQGLAPSQPDEIARHTPTQPDETARQASLRQQTTLNEYDIRKEIERGLEAKKAHDEKIKQEQIKKMNDKLEIVMKKLKELEVKEIEEKKSIEEEKKNNETEDCDGKDQEMYETHSFGNFPRANINELGEFTQPEEENVFDDVWDYFSG